MPPTGWKKYTECAFCGKPITKGAGGYCRACYERRRRNGVVVPIQTRFIGPLPKCLVENCLSVSTVLAGGYCGKHNYKFFKYGDPLARAAPETKVGKHQVGVRRVCAILETRGMICDETNQTKCPYDILVNKDWRVEYKTSNGRFYGSGKYQGRYRDIFFNLHRHNIAFDASSADFLWMHNEREGIDFIVPSAPFHGTKVLTAGKKVRRFNLSVEALCSILNHRRKG